MKKPIIFALSAALMLAGSLVGCDKTSSVASSSSEKTSEAASSSSEASKVSVTLDKTTLALKVGETFTLTATTSPASQTVVYSTSDDKVATVGKDGKVIAAGVGTCDITATTKDKLTAVCKVTVTLEDTPAMPTDDKNAVEIPTTTPTLDASHKDGFEASYVTDLTRISWTADAIKTEYWNNTVSYTIPETLDLTRKTEVHIYGRASAGMSIYYKLLANNEKIGEGELSFSAKFSDEKIAIPEETRYLLPSATTLLIYAPKPGAYTEAGNFDLAHAYLSGDADEGLAPGEYDPTKYTSLYDFPVTSSLADLNSAGIIYDQITGAKGDCTVTYGADGVVFTNKNGFNDWGDYAFKFPEYNGSEKVDYTGACKLVAKINASAGAVLKYRAGWNGDLSEKHVTAEEGGKDFYITLDVSKVVAWDTLLDFAPLYRDSGFDADLTITVKSLQAVALKA